MSKTHLIIGSIRIICLLIQTYISIYIIFFQGFQIGIPVLFNAHLTGCKLCNGGFYILPERGLDCGELLRIRFVLQEQVLRQIFRIEIRNYLCRLIKQARLIGIRTYMSSGLGDMEARNSASWFIRPDQKVFF